MGENGLLKQLTKALVERALQAELTTHLGYEKHSLEGHNSGNTRNGTSSKQLKGEFGEVQIEVRRDRQASFEPKLVAKGQTRFAGFDEKILSLYARGHDHTRDPGASGRDVPGRGIAHTDFQCDRGGPRRGEGLAGTAAGCDLCDRLSGCAGGEDAQRWPGREPGGVCGHRHYIGRAEGSAWAMDLGQRRSQVLAAGSDGDEKPGIEGYLHRVCGWTERLSSGD